MCEHPVQDADLGDATENGGGHLHLEEQLRRELHVLTELHVRCEFDSLSRGDVAIRHEDLMSKRGRQSMNGNLKKVLYVLK